MGLSEAQIRGRIKNEAQKNHADARSLMRIYMMERFLERLSCSPYKDNFVIKGGILVTSMVGVSMRATMDIDASLKNQNLDAENARRIVEAVKDIDVNDGITFEVKSIEGIMDEMEYPGIRIALDAVMGRMRTPIKIDISTGDVITPRAIEYEYPLLLEKRNISLWAYNLETVLAEKYQTIIVRDIANTRMRDFYDIHTLLNAYRTKIDFRVLKAAYVATSQKRESEQLFGREDGILSRIEKDAGLTELWESYRKKYAYAADIPYSDTIMCLKELQVAIAEI